MKKLKVIIILFVLCLSTISIYPVASVSANNNYSVQVSNAVGFLRFVQASDGDIGGFGISCWATMAIAAAGQNPNTWAGSGGQSIVSYLESYAAANVNSSDSSYELDLAKFILAMTAANVDPSAINGVNYVSLLENSGSVSGQAITTRLNMAFWGLLALVSAGARTNSSAVQAAVSFIESNQNSNGGWSYGTLSVAPDVDDTAAGIMALAAAGLGSSSYVSNALTYLKGQQQSNGGFYDFSAPTDSASDAWVIDAIVSAGQDPASTTWTVNGSSPITDLLTYQNPNGSFNWTLSSASSYAWYTSYAIPALCYVPYPVDVPEFPSYLILPLFMIITLLGAIIFKKKQNVRMLSASARKAALIRVRWSGSQVRPWCTPGSTKRLSKNASYIASARSNS